ncbi:MAG: YhfC family intramembrane metalloprotease [Myxococcaceae bacterium]|nr:YhfC family intramembrane metalloprotease [Myxococcaceae bacterium]
MISNALIASFTASGLFACLAPVALMLFVRRTLRTDWRWFAVGAAAFTVSQLLTRIPMIAVLGSVLKKQLEQPAVQWVWIAALCISAGLFEETARYLCFRYLMKDAREWKNAIALGVGHGGIEAVTIVGLSAFSSVITILLINSGHFPTSLLPADQPETLQKITETFLKLHGWEPLLGIWERGVALTFHIAASCLVLQRFLRGQSRWYWYAVALHAVTNGVAVVTMRMWGAVQAEAVLTVFWVISGWIIARTRPREGERSPVVLERMG